MEDRAVVLSVLGLPEEGRVRSMGHIVLCRAFMVSTDLWRLLLLLLQVLALRRWLLVHKHRLVLSTTIVAAEATVATIEVP